MKTQRRPIKRVSDGKVGIFIETVQKEDIIASAEELLSMSVDDLDPYRKEFQLYMVLMMGEFCTGSGLSKKEVEILLGRNASTSYRYLNESVLRPLIYHSPPPWGDKHHDNRHHLFSLITPSQNPQISDEEKIRIRQLERSISKVLTSKRLLGLFLWHIGKGLENPRVMDEVLDILAWLYEVFRESYLRLSSLPSINERSGEALANLNMILFFMKHLFKNGRDSKLGRTVLYGYSLWWQLKPGAEPPIFEGRDEIIKFIRVLMRPIITGSKE
jgi:hypothetical protein